MVRICRQVRAALSEGNTLRAVTYYLRACRMWSDTWRAGAPALARDRAHRCVLAVKPGLMARVSAETRASLGRVDL